MEYRKLGRTGLDVGVIGLGTEHLEKKRETMEEVLRAAVDAGIPRACSSFAIRTPVYIDPKAQMSASKPRTMVAFLEILLSVDSVDLQIAQRKHHPLHAPDHYSQE